MTTNAVANQKTLQQIINETSSGSKGRNTGELGKDDFLNLLVTQLRYQDPLNPVDDKEFIGQMAQFSALEQMQNMNGSFSSVKAFSLIGKRVSASIIDETTKEVKPIEGDVTSVKMNQGKTFVVVRGQDVPIDRITDVTEGLRSSNSNLSAYTNLIGFDVDGAVYNPSTGEIVDVNGVVKAISKGIYEDYAVMDGVNVEIAEIVTENPSTNPDFIKDYLTDNKGKEVSVMVKDPLTGEKVAVTAVLRSFNIKDGKVTAVLDGVNVPVESIMNIKAASVQPTAPQEEAEEEPADEAVETDEAVDTSGEE